MLKQSSKRPGHARRIFFTVLLVVFLIFGSSQAWCDSLAVPSERGIFGQIVEEGLSGTVCSANLAVIKSACNEEHSDQDGRDWSDDTELGVGKIFRFVDRQTAKMLNLAGSADINPVDRAKFLFHFGLVMRALTEFYLRSNYLELKIESQTAQPFDPYKIEPINWTRVGKDQRAIAIAGFKFGEFDKSSPKLPEGAKKLKQATYFSMSKELTVKEAQREWNTVERLIRVRYPQKAPEIVIALKNAGCAGDFKPDSED